MPHSYLPAGPLRLLALPLLLVAARPLTTQAQALNYDVASAISRAGTYTDLGSSGTLISTADFDDANSAVLPVGFTFYYNGTQFTQFVLNTNGFIKLGTVPPALPGFSPYAQAPGGGPLASSTETDLLLPFNTDLMASGVGTTEYRMAISGIAPGRVLTVQWENVADKPRPTSATDPTPVPGQLANFSFQARLYEVTGQIEFVYGPATPAPAASQAASFVTIGLKGTGANTNQVVLAQKAAADAWAATTFRNTVYPAGGPAHTVSGAVLPDLGRTYTFGVRGGNDATVTDLQGYGAVLAAPGGAPVTLRALVRNVGSQPLPILSVTLTVTGANPQTVVAQTAAVIPVNGATTVTFANVSLPLVGTNMLAVSVPPDGNNANNTLRRNLISSPTDFSLIDPTQGASSAFGFNPGTEAGFAAKFTLAAPRDIMAVRAYVANFTSNPSVGHTVYGVVVDPVSGAVLGRSADWVITAADANALHTFALTTPVTRPAGDFLVGLVQAADPTLAQTYVMGVQDEDPARPNLYYSVSAASSTPSPPVPASATFRYRYMLEAVTAPVPSCPAPANFTAANITPTTARVGFTGPSNGTSYQLVYGPTGFSPTAGTVVSGPTATFNLSGLQASTCYDVYARVVCSPTDQSTLAGPFAFCTPCVPPIIATYPYGQNFDVKAPGQALPCGVTVSDDNGDNFTWADLNNVPSALSTTVITRNNSPGAMVYSANPDGFTAADDWFYLPAMRFTAGQRYRLSFYYRRGTAALAEALEVKYGPAANAAAQTTLLWSNLNINGPNYTLANNSSTPAVADLAPTATGLYYVGFHAISQADKQYLAVDDVTVTAVLATSAAFSRALSVYPNPSASGRFTLAVSGANAPTGLRVDVTDALGRCVYTGAARDNFRNELNLAHLPAGIYTLRCWQGGDYGQQRLVIR